MHIQHGAHPIFFYGQNYMGALEAYIDAVLFSLFGVSVYTLRLGIVLVFILFLTSMYLLTRMLYTRNLALFTILLLSLGSIEMLIRQLSAIGGYAETVLFASLCFLIAAWLALSSSAYGAFLGTEPGAWLLAWVYGAICSSCHSSPVPL